MKVGAKAHLHATCVITQLLMPTALSPQRVKLSACSSQIPKHIRYIYIYVGIYVYVYIYIYIYTGLCSCAYSCRKCHH